MNKINTIKTISALVISALSSASCQMNFDERLQHEAEDLPKTIVRKNLRLAHGLTA